MEADAITRINVAKIGRRHIWRRALDFVFGYDFFISYAWVDGGPYAEKLARALEMSGFEVFLDRNDFRSGDDWKQVGAWTLRRTGQLILVGTPAAAHSKPVAREVKLFRATGRRIIPIDFEGSLDASLAGSMLAGYLSAEFLRIRESKDAIEHGPSSNTLAALRRTFNLVRQDKKRVTVLAAIVALLSVLSLASIMFAVTAESQRQLAVGRYLAVSAEALVKEEVAGGTNKELLSALVVEALKRLPAAEGRKLAATVALRIGTTISDSAYGPARVEFLSGRNELAVLDKYDGLKLINLDQAHVRTVDPKEFDGDEFSDRSHHGHYLVIHSFGHTTAYLIDTVTLKVIPVPAEHRSAAVSPDEHYLTSTGSSDFKINQLPGLSQRRISLDEGIRYLSSVSYFDGKFVFSFLNHIVVVEPQAEAKIFDLPYGQSAVSLASTGAEAFFVARRDPWVPSPSPPPQDRGFRIKGKAILTDDSPHGLYRLNLATGAVSEVNGFSGARAIIMSRDKGRIAIRGEGGIHVLDIKTDARVLFPSADEGEPCRHGLCDLIVLSGTGVITKERTGWHFVDLSTHAVWHVPQGNPESLKLARATSAAILIGEHDFAIVDFSAQSVLARGADRLDATEVALNDQGDLAVFGVGKRSVLADLDPLRLRATLCSGAGRNLDAGTWRKYLPDEAWRPTCPDWK